MTGGWGTYSFLSYLNSMCRTSSTPTSMHTPAPGARRDGRSVGHGIRWAVSDEEGKCTQRNYKKEVGTALTELEKNAQGGGPRPRLKSFSLKYDAFVELSHRGRCFVWETGRRRGADEIRSPCVY